MLELLLKEGVRSRAAEPYGVIGSEKPTGVFALFIDWYSGTIRATPAVYLCGGGKMLLRCQLKHVVEVAGSHNFTVPCLYAIRPHNLFFIMKPTTEVTLLLQAAGRGDMSASERLWKMVYEELHRIAHRQLAGEYNRRHLSTTALVHEAYLRLVDDDHIEWESRAHFYGIAARIMRRVLVDNARRYRALKRGGGQADESFDEARFVPEERIQEVIDVDDALTQLCRIHERWCRVVECKYFGGLKEDEIAKILGVSVRTVERDWVKARTWLYNHMYASPVAA